jgi:hypothetical protein
MQALHECIRLVDCKSLSESQHKSLEDVGIVWWEFETQSLRSYQNVEKSFESRISPVH